MWAYAVQASLGDDVYHEPSTLAFEEHVAQLLGKEAALFMPSGTMSNQIALRTHLKQPPYSVLCDYRSHVNKYEAGGAAFHSGAHTIPIIPSNGENELSGHKAMPDLCSGHHMTLSDVKNFIVIDHNIH